MFVENRERSAPAARRRDDELPAAVGEALPVSEGKLVNGNGNSVGAAGAGEMEDGELYSAPPAVMSPGVTVRGMLTSLFAILPIGLSLPVRILL